MKKATILFLLFASIVANAQQWSCFSGNDTLYYLEGKAYRGLMATDSITGANMVNYSIYRTIDFDPNCNANATNNTPNSQKIIWAGANVIKFNNGDFQFFNKRGEAITIKSQAEVGDTWNWYVDSMGNIIYAKVVANDTATILDNITDSVKTILLTVPFFTTAFLPQWDSIIIKLSANYGLLNPPAFYNFPDDKKQLNRSTKPLTNGDMYHYEIGDYWQIKSTSVSFLPSNSTSVSYEYFEVLDKVAFPAGDSAAYTVYREKQTQNGNRVSEISKDTVRITYHNLGKVAGSGVPQGKIGIGIVAHLYSINNPNLNQRTIGNKVMEIDNRFLEYGIGSDSCLGRAMYLDNDQKESYIECLGVLKRSYGIGGSYEQNLIYHNICGSLGGYKVELLPTPVGVEQTNLTDIMVYPNPAEHIVTIENPGSTALKATLFTLAGSMSGQITVSAFTNAQLNLAEIPNGFYWLLLDNGHSKAYKKLLVAK